MSVATRGIIAAGVVALVALPGTVPVFAEGLLALGAFVLLFTRLPNHGLLEEGVRPRIVQLLQEEPGLGITDVCARLGIGWGTAVHHLTRLERAGLVVSQESGRRRRFFLPGESATRRTAVCVLSSDINRRILELVRDRPGLSQTHLCQALGISPPLAHKYLARLIREQLVTTQRHWRTVQYFPAPSALATLEAHAQLTGTQGDQGPTAPA